MNVRIEKALIEQKPILERLMQLYLYEFTEMQQFGVNSDGLFEYEHLHLYWSEPGYFPFLLYVDNAVAGFILVNSYIVLNQKDEAKSIAEFFVMRRYRRRGVGRTAAFRIFDMFPGKWEVRQIQPNVPAQRFWRKIIGEYTGGRFTETAVENELWHGPVQRFDNTRPMKAGGERHS